MRRRVMLLALCCVGLALLAGHRQVKRVATSARGYVAQRPPLRLEDFPQKPSIEAPRVVIVRKQRRALALYLGGRRSAVYPIGLGWDPVGPKAREGDGRTPEGTYYVCTRNARSRFHLFLGLSYPNAEDARKALREGRISPDESRRIRAAQSGRSKPPWETPLGGEVGIHGAGAATDWTAGCIALENEDLDELWSHLRVGDPVLILP